MCGITGGWWVQEPADLNGRVAYSLSKLRKRGPNDQGSEIYRFVNGTVILGHTRLSIIDLSAAGHQPMVSKNGRYSLVFNGEIYNYRELRKELVGLGHVFSSDSDTEVLLAAWEEWHINCLTRFEGMFAFVVYDQQKKTLSCVRDGFGIKPFFYDQRQNRFLFASEQAALLTLREEQPQPDWQRCYDYLVHADYDSQERTFIDGVKHLLPGHWLELDLSSQLLSEQQCWWRPQTLQSSSLTFTQAAEAVREQFLCNIRLHLRSDVPLGAALSGGIDSSAVVCAMRYVEPDLPINTFSYIAAASELSEEKWVDRVNQYTGAKAHKVTATNADLSSDLDRMITAQGEPFGSTSIYAQYRVFQLAREQGVTVTLDGQGADELLAGYNGYPGYRLLSLLGQGNFRAAHRFAVNWSRWPGRSYKLALMSLGRIVLPNGLYANARKRLGRDFSPDWLNVDRMSDAGVQLTEAREPLDQSGRGRRVVEQLADSLQYRGLPALLRHGDRNSMQFSVESRVPFLTMPMANLLLSLPEHYLISNNGETKSIFRAAMRGIVPDDVLDRKDKIGFATPEREWLLGMASTVREWLQASNGVPFLSRDALLKRFDAVVDGSIPFSWQVWRWVNFVRWYEQSEIGQ